MDVVGTTWVEMTPQVHVSIAQNLLAAESSDHVDGARVHKIIVVPGDLMRVHEQRDITEIVVVVNNVSQIHHNLVSLIPRNSKLGIGVINGVDRGTEQDVVSEKELRHPIGVFFG